MKKTKKKLDLKRQTIRVLTPPKLAQVAGGMMPEECTGKVSGCGFPGGGD